MIPPSRQADSRPTRWPLRQGFSLVELVLTLAIIGTLAGIAMPRYQNSLKRYRVDRAANRLAMDLALFRQEARMGSTSREVLFNPATDAYGVRELVSLSRGSDAYRVDLSEAPYHVDILSADFGGDTTLVFNGYGIPDSGGTVVLQAGDIQKTVILDADTTRASIQ